MTTKPRAKKFRVRRSYRAGVTQAASHAPQAGGEAAPRVKNALEELAQSTQEDGFPDQKFPTARAGANAADQPQATVIEAIRREGLTGRQLRTARRLAHKHGLPAMSDFDAVRLLRQAGIDPFRRSAMLELVSADGETTATPPKLPQTVRKSEVPSTDIYDVSLRAQSVMDIQMDIARRRRRKVLALVARLAFFVGLPTLIAGFYYARVATPIYATNSEFIIQQADGGSVGGAGSFLAGTGLATSQDSITVQSYLTSRDAMLRLDQDAGFKAHFQDEAVDPLQRLPADASNEDAYKVYKRYVKIGFDPSEGIIKMEVAAADPEISRLYSEALIRYAEERVDNLTQRKRRDQMAGARDSYEEAEANMLAAQAEVERLQQEMGVFDATGEGASVMSQISGYEVQLLDKQIQMRQLLDNPIPNQARVDGVRSDIARLDEVIAQLRAKLTANTGGSGSLAAISGKLEVARINLETRTLLMQQALQQLENSRIEANKQTRYLSLGVTPVPPDEPTYPRVFDNTMVAFLIFSGIYLMVSLTASILREQVSA